MKILNQFNQRSKKTLPFFILLIAFTLLIIQSCSKQTNDASDEIPKNEKLTITGKGGILVTAEDVYSTATEFKRMITITDPNTGTTFPAIYLTFTSAKKNKNIYKQLREDKSNVDGILTVEVGGSKILTQSVVKGKDMTMKRSVINTLAVADGDPVKDPKVPCTITTVHDCVSYKIEDMNVVEYAFCLAGAPACYAELWASCTWDVCHEKIRYTNPV
jgi:hypothetical protein